MAHWRGTTLVMDGGEQFRQIGWKGFTGRWYDLNEDPKQTEPGGFTPVYECIEIKSN